MRLRRRNSRTGALAVVLAVLSAPAPVLASSSGGTSLPAPSTPPATAPAQTGGAQPGGAVRPPRTGRRRPVPRPVLARFDVSARKFYDLGRPARVTFRIDGRARSVAVKLLVIRRGERIRTIDLGDRATRRTHSIALTGREGGRLPQGALELRLTARDGRGRGLRASTRASATGLLSFYWHRFPIAGPHDYGSTGSRFGAERPGRVHQGQDLSAPSGTPIVAPHAGIVENVAYQAGGAGHYIVLRGSGENRSYIFMHLLDGSVRVREGQRVRTGQRLGAVGSTGSSSGPHLHFEIWVGPWFAGGRPIDPLPHLRRWDAWS